ncbi:MAG: PilZ domain-containing protein [Syntrophales bacterium]
MSIKPGTSVEITLDRWSEGGEPLRAHVYEVEGKRLILSQTTPPIIPPPPRVLYVTYVVEQGDKARRMGFTAAVSALEEGYALVSGQQVPAVIVVRKGEPEEASLRKGFRIRTPSNSGLSLTIGGRRYVIFDISLTGMNFIQPLADHAFKAPESLDCRFTIDGQRYPLTVRVVRVAETAGARRVAVTFLNTVKEMQPILSRKILLLERRELSGQD